MEFNIIPDSEALSRCAWCRGYIDENSEVFGLGVTFKPEADLSQYQSHCIEMELLSEEKSVFMIVSKEGSPASQQGKDGMFMVCSQKCAGQLKKAMEEEVSLGKFFAGVEDG